MDRTTASGSTTRALACVLVSLVAWNGAPTAGDSGREKLAQAREAAKAGDLDRCRTLCIEALDADADSLALRLEVAQVAEAVRKDPRLAREHYAEIANAAERAARNKEPLSDEDAKAAKEAASKARVLPDPYSKELAAALKEHFAATMKAARNARTKKHWTFAGDLVRSVKNLYAALPNLLDSKDAVAKEAEKLLNESISKRSEDHPDVPEALKAERSEQVAALARDLTALSTRAFAAYEEVRGPYTRKRALAPLAILVGLRNDTQKHAESAAKIWERARAIEPTATAKVRIATDARRWEVRVNGRKIADSGGLATERNFREVPVELFREVNLIGFFGHEVTDKKKKKGDEGAVSRVWTLIDVAIGEKDHVATDKTWSSTLAPPDGWDTCPNSGIDSFPTTPLGFQTWDYERTKTWAGDTLVGDVGDTFLFKLFDLPPGHAVSRKPPGTASAPASGAASAPAASQPAGSDGEAAK